MATEEITEHGSYLTKTIRPVSTTIANHATENAISTPNNKTSKTINHISLVGNSYLTKKCNNIPDQGGTYDILCQYTILISD
ncbi:hypothetical protein G9A89_001343 [Geosiphon pyriformis]|nr:hypothetical protein G9A89_001343 [Geosiphon pyriformis]